jgi:hypothetical protein
MRLGGPGEPGQGAGPAKWSDEEIIEAVAGRIVRMGMTAPAVFFLESSKPLAYVGSQALVFFEPFVKSFLNFAHYDRFVALMENRENVERLIRRVEELDDAALREERERKRAARAARARDGEAPGVWARLRRWLRRRDS